MKIWFGTTTLRFEEYIEYYLAIRDYLIEKKHIVLFDWLDEAITYRKKDPKAPRNIKGIYQEVLSAINQADCSVIEYTVPNFSTSHQINYSLHKRKPTLVLRLHKDNSYADSYIDAVESPFLKVIEYNLKNFKEILDEYFWQASKDENGKGRYNIVLDQQHKYYLDWASTKYQKSRSEIIRDSIETEIKKDQKYKQFMKQIKKN
jgi:hypothetical protein